MKSIDPKERKQLPGVPLAQTDTFTFRCHKDLTCFNQCCRNLNLFLYPYDVLRLKTALEISSDLFIERFVDVVLRKGSFFPDVLLRPPPPHLLRTEPSGPISSPRSKTPPEENFPNPERP